LGGLPIYKEAWENRDSFSWTNHNQFADREFFYLLEVSVERVGRDTTFGRILSAII
jgi:hypothetical protein